MLHLKPLQCQAKEEDISKELSKNTLKQQTRIKVAQQLMV